jgi:O-acetyl-ADP-ribose deacetylase (regulator of RNase III)
MTCGVKSLANYRGIMPLSTDPAQILRYESPSLVTAGEDVNPSTQIMWTNKSVVRFAGQADPILLIEEKARDLVLRARDAGWLGPPYNPMVIADLLKIPLEANGDIPDARTVNTDSGLKIEFNPTRPRERVRFSIAHEIAHTLFSDVAEQTRHRSGPKTTQDEWQLEMLCNLAAAEFVMPLGSLPPSDHLPSIEQLMVNRRKFDVSTEAFLIRVVKTTSEPTLMFCASAIQAEETVPSYRVDYSIASRSAPAALPVGTRIPRNSVVHSCTAIGHTIHASEGWIAESALPIECVGIPAFAGATYPRVAGIVRFGGQDAQLDPFQIVHGNVLTPTGAGPKIICQLVNDQARTWGGGVARAAAQKYPSAQNDYSSWLLQIPKRERLGRVHFFDVNATDCIASLIAQEGFGPSPGPRIRYAPLAECFQKVAAFAKDRNAGVHLPRIGLGQSGGSWDTVEEIILDTLTAIGVRVTVYDLPPKRQTSGVELLI